MPTNQRVLHRDTGTELMSNSDRSADTSPSPRKRRLRRVHLLAVVAGILICRQVLVVVSSRYVRNIIRRADAVEVHAFFVNNDASETTLARLTDREQIEELADAVRIAGIWIPADILIANSYRIRIFNGADTRDIVLRGGMYITLDEVWFARLASDTLQRIHAVVEQAGGQRPNWRAMRTQSARR